MQVREVVEDPALGSLVNQHQVEEQFSKAFVKTKACKDGVINQKCDQRIEIDILRFAEKSSHTIFVPLNNVGVFDSGQVYLGDVQVKNVEVIVIQLHCTLRKHGWVGTEQHSEKRLMKNWYDCVETDQSFEFNGCYLFDL